VVGAAAAAVLRSVEWARLSGTGDLVVSDAAVGARRAAGAKPPPALAASVERLTLGVAGPAVPVGRPPGDSVLVDAVGVAGEGAGAGRTEAPSMGARRTSAGGALGAVVIGADGAAGCGRVVGASSADTGERSADRPSGSVPAVGRGAGRSAASGCHIGR
jgi:hypothetical protein